MGRWSQREYERQLLGKVRKLLQVTRMHHVRIVIDVCSEKSLEDPLLDRPRDTRFTTFIRKLDPEDKTAQACFQSLVQVGIFGTQIQVDSDTLLANAVSCAVSRSSTTGHA